MIFDILSAHGRQSLSSEGAISRRNNWFDTNTSYATRSHTVSLRAAKTVADAIVFKDRCCNFDESTLVVGNVVCRGYQYGLSHGRLEAMSDEAEG